MSGGGEEFRRELLAAVRELAQPQDAGEEVRQSALAKAEGIAQEELARRQWGHTELAGLRKGAAGRG